MALFGVATLAVVALLAVPKSSIETSAGSAGPAVTPTAPANVAAVASNALEPTGAPRPESSNTKSIEPVKAAATEPAKVVATEPAAARLDALPLPRVDADVAVTISGCLERDEAKFRLADVTGANVPKSRSWKSGFLKKHPAPIEIVDANGTLTLPALVGQRVSASGTLLNGEMRARALKSMSASCR